MFLKLILTLDDLDELARAELINVIPRYQSRLPGIHFLPKEAAIKYQGILALLHNFRENIGGKSWKRFFMESLRDNFNQVCISAILISFVAVLGQRTFCQKIVLENFAKFTEKHLRRSHILNKL